MLLFCFEGEERRVAGRGDDFATCVKTEQNGELLLGEHSQHLLSMYGAF